MARRIKNWMTVLCTREVVSYLFFGLLTTVVSIVGYAVCYRLGMSTAMGNTVSTIVTVLFAYLVNKIFVFQSREWRPVPLLKEAAAFFLARLVMYVVETLLLVLLVDKLGIWSLGAKLGTAVLVIVSNYMLSKKAVFRT